MNMKQTDVGTCAERANNCEVVLRNTARCFRETTVTYLNQPIKCGTYASTGIHNCSWFVSHYNWNTGLCNAVFCYMYITVTVEVPKQ
jgi:hypothetical protein